MSTTTASLTATAAASASSSPPPPPFSLYSHPRLYDAVFAFRDFDAEARFLVDAWRLFGGEGESKNQPLSSFLDVGCGTGRHGAALARLLSPSSSPSSSLSLFALDSSPEMLSAAARAAEEAGCPLRQAIQADMTRGFEISDKVQVALCALGTLAHALPAPPSSSSSGPDSDPFFSFEADPALGALRAASAALVPGGLLILELPAAGDLFDGTLLAGDAWDVPAGAWKRDGGGGSEKPEPEQPEPKRRIGQISKKKAPPSTSSPALIVEYGLPDDDFDPVAQVLTRTVVVSEANSESGEAEQEVGREEVRQRLFTPAEVRALAREAGFAVAAELGDMEIENDEGKSIPTAREGDRYVAVLVKKRK